jgi:hypothetical protein
VKCRIGCKTLPSGGSRLASLTTPAHPHLQNRSYLPWDRPSYSRHSPSRYEHEASRYGWAGAEHAPARHASLTDLHERPTPNCSEKHVVVRSGWAASCIPGPEDPGIRALACEGARNHSEFLMGCSCMRCVLVWCGMQSTCL